MRSRGWPAVRRSGRYARCARCAAMCASRLRRSDRRRAAAHACRLSRSCPRTTTARHRARGCPHASRGAFDGRRRPIGAPRRRTSRPSRPVRRALRPRGARGPYRACPHRTRAHPSRAVHARRGRQGDCRRGRQGVRRCGAPASRRCGACPARTPRRAHRARRRAWPAAHRSPPCGRRRARAARSRDALAFGCRGRVRRPARASRAAFAAPRGAAGLAADADFAAGFAAAGFAPAAFGSGRATLRAVRLPERTGARPGVAGRGFLTVNFVRINAGILTLRSRAAARFRLGSADGCRTSRCRRA
ncbi:rNA pseudouridine synthase family protein [Burkholderia pseudomallei MSHR511]|nr:rNA pseudouridine synthase family protein [Burkholderia pseudomallei MSHR511]